MTTQTQPKQQPQHFVDQLNQLLAERPRRDGIKTKAKVISETEFWIIQNSDRAYIIAKGRALDADRFRLYSFAGDMGFKASLPGPLRFRRTYTYAKALADFRRVLPRPHPQRPVKLKLTLLLLTLIQVIWPLVEIGHFLMNGRLPSLFARPYAWAGWGLFCLGVYLGARWLDCRWATAPDPTE